MKPVCKIACLALLMNTLPGLGQERVFYKTVQVNGLNIFYREAGPSVELPRFSIAAGLHVIRKTLAYPAMRFLPPAGHLTG